MKYLAACLAIGALSSGYALPAEPPGTLSPGQWTPERAWAWQSSQPWLVGFNYIPATAINTTEMWQADTFDPKTIDAELALAEHTGFNCARVFLQYLVWENDPRGLEQRIDRFLSIAQKHGIRTLFVLFDDCACGAMTEPFLGKQPDVIPGAFANGWTPSPGPRRVLDRATWPRLEAYVRAVVGRFHDDPRVLGWDVYNEPSNTGMGNKSLQLVKAAFTWARQARPSQPLTAGVWGGTPESTRLCLELSDVISFHCYGKAAELERRISELRGHLRPIVCTEWLNRPLGSVVETVLPVLERQRVGAFHWGLVNGKMQTQFPWGSRAGAPEPKVWQHDLFRKDHTPYNGKELALFKEAIRRGASGAAAAAGQWPAGAAAARDSTYRGWRSLALGNGLIELQVLPEIGGCIIQFRLGGKEFLWVNPQLAGRLPPRGGLAADGAWFNVGGDKLWPAPQGWDNDRQWPGPPDAVLDGQPYTLERLRTGSGEAAIRLTSGNDPRSGIQLSRVVRVFEGSTRVSFEATMKNVDTRPRRWGLWAHTQLDAAKPDGSAHNPLIAWCPLNPRSKFPGGYDVIFGAKDNPSFQPDRRRGLMRVQYQYRVGKIGLDSHAGWVATVDGASGAVFVQRFVFEPDKDYPDGSSVEFWLNGVGRIHAYNKEMVMLANAAENPYVFESEVLSPLAERGPGQSTTWRYDWYASRIGPDLPVLGCTDAGVVAEPLAATVVGDGVRLRGRFGVFAPGHLEAVGRDERGREVGRQRLLLPVSPLTPAPVDATIKLPPSATTVVLTVVGADGRCLGELGRGSIRRP